MGKRILFAVNFVLLLVAASALLLYFWVHARPHMTTVLFGAFNLLVIGPSLWTLIKAIVGDQQTAIREFLHRVAATIVLVAGLAVIAAFFAVTGTVYFSSKLTDVTLEVSQAGKRTETVIISADEKTPAITRFGLFHPIKVDIATETPHGYDMRHNYVIRRVWPVTLPVPEESLKKKFHIVRLLPGAFFDTVRGRTDPDPRYHLKINIPGEPVHELNGLMYRAILFGASQTDLEDQANETRSNDRSLRNYLGTATKDEADQIIKEWLEHPFLIGTRELRQGDPSITVELTPTNGPSLIQVPIRNEVNDIFLVGAPK